MLLRVIKYFHKGHAENEWQNQALKKIQSFSTKEILFKASHSTNRKKQNKYN